MRSRSITCLLLASCAVLSAGCPAATPPGETEGSSGDSGTGAAGTTMVDPTAGADTSSGADASTSTEPDPTPTSDSGSGSGSSGSSGSSEQCVLTGNVSTDGAGIYAYIGAQLVLDQTTITGNLGGIGGGVAMNGDGLTDSLTMTGCTIADNSADEIGGGMVLFDVPQVSIAGSSIHDNTGLDGAGLDGAGLGVAGSQVTLTDTAVVRNTATGTGGGMLLQPGTGVVTVDGDWGTGVDDNAPQDVVVPGVGSFSGYGAAASFECDATGCS